MHLVVCKMLAIFAVPNVLNLNKKSAPSSGLAVCHLGWHPESVAACILSLKVISTEPNDCDVLIMMIDTGVLEPTIAWKQLLYRYCYHLRQLGHDVFTLCVCLLIIRNSEVMFSPCLFVFYLCASRCFLFMKEWCHTNHILQEYRWGSLVMQVMLDILMTSSMTSPGKNVGQILKLPHLGQFSSYSVKTNICPNLWLAGHLSDTLKFLFRFEGTP